MDRYTQLMPGRPKLGQHFLADQLVLERIASAAASAGDTVVEIGPGRGALTRLLARNARQVVAVELDGQLAAELWQRCGNPPNLEVVGCNILDVNLTQVFKEIERNKCVVTGNLPYYITSPILRFVLGAGHLMRSATFLMQEEVADRVVAEPGSKSFGYLSCLCQLQSDPAKLFSVEPGAFIPAPRVRSAVVRFAMSSEPPPRGLLSFLGTCFRSPRKTLRNNLAGHYPATRLAADPLAGMRAQQLKLRELKGLWLRLNA